MPSSAFRFTPFVEDLSVLPFVWDNGFWFFSTRCGGEGVKEEFDALLEESPSEALVGGDEANGEGFCGELSVRGRVVVKSRLVSLLLVFVGGG